MALKTYEALEVMGNGFLKASEYLKDDDKLSTKESIELIISVVKELASEYIDNEE